MPERELSNVIAMQKNMFFFLCSWKTKKLCFCCCVWIVFAKFNFFLGSRRPFSYVFMNFTLLWGCVRSVLVFRSFCAVCGICIFHCLVGAWREVRFSLFITVTWNPLKTKGLESALWHKKSRFYRMFLKSGKHSSSSNISHFINIHRFLHSKYVAISWASVSSSNGSLNFFNLTPGNNRYRHAENTTPKRSMVARYRHLSKIGSDRRLIPVNRPESPFEFWDPRVGSFNEVLFFGAVGYLKRSRTGMMDSSHLLMLIIWPLFFWSDLKPKKHVFHKLFFTPAYFWIVSQKSGTFIFFNPAWLLKQLHSLCDLLSLTRNQIWLPR